MAAVFDSRRKEEKKAWTLGHSGKAPPIPIATAIF